MTFDVPAITLPDFLKRAVEASPDAPAIHHRGSTYTYADVDRMAHAAATVVGPGDAPVLLALGNRPEFAAWYFGALLAGRTLSAASPHLAPNEIEDRADDLQPGVVIAEEALVDAYQDDAPEGARVLPPDIPQQWPGEGEDLHPSPPDAIAVLQYTSGTTGGMKAAAMSHENLVANALQNNAWFDWTSDDVVLGALPLHHTWGMGCVLNASVAAGASIALADARDAPGMLDVIARRRVTVIYGSATMLGRLLDAAGDDAPAAFASVRYVKAGAMLVGGALPGRWADAVPDVPLVLGYGLTEAGPEVANNPLGRPKRGTVGVALPGTEIRICVPDSPDSPLAAGDEGEIQVRGPQVTSGYWKRPEETRAAFVGDGWLRTGDLGKLDAEGYLTVVDRLKDLIKFRGWSVVPAQVERALLQHPAVAEAIVIGAPDPADGEVPVAFLRLAVAQPPTDEELAAHLAPRLSREQRPRRYVFVDDIPKNAVGKPLRRALRDRLRDEA